MTAVTYSTEFADFLEELGAEESIDREFKEAKSKLPSSIWETISAFANTSGGTLVLGVRQLDDGLALVGVTDPNRLVEDFHNQCRNTQKINRDVFRSDDIAIRVVDGLSVLVIRVRPVDPRSRPIFINGQPYGGTRVRRHSGDYIATEEEVKRMMREASDLPADMVILPWARPAHLDQDAVAAYRRRALIMDERSPLAEFDDIEFLQAIDGYRKDAHSGNSGITVAGLLMFGNEDAIRHWRPRHLIDARLLPPGADQGEPDWADRVLWENHLFGAYDRLYPWLTQDLPVPFRLEQGVRVDESEQHRVLREALVNMLVHADYAERDASLILRWDGGVLFRNPGRSRIPAPGFHSGNRSDPRNPALLRMFRRIGRAEEAGTGMPRIFRAWRELGYGLPEIDPGDGLYEFAMTLPYQHLLSDDDRSWLAGIGGSLSHPEQLALVICRFDGGVDNQALRGVTGLHGADASKVLTGLRDRGLLDMVGSKRGAWYRLLPDRGWHSTDGNSKNTEDKHASTDGNSKNTEDKHASTDGYDRADAAMILESEDELQRLAKPIRDRKRIAPDQLADVIVSLCAVQPLSLRELMALLQRSEPHMRATLTALEATGRIQLLFTQRQHPMQKYLAPPNKPSLK